MDEPPDRNGAAEPPGAGVPAGDDTSWHLVVAAAGGGAQERAEFVRRYTPIVRAYLEARWRHPVLRQSIDDAVQETFVDCFRQNGALGRADPAKPQRFRAFLYGVTRIVALRFERARTLDARHHPRGESAVAAAVSPDESLARTFDRAFAMELLRRAGQLHERRARLAGGDVLRRHELLVARFRDGLPIREIADRWGADPAWLHHQYAAARDEFKTALLDVARDEYGGQNVEAKCARLLDHLG